MKQIIQARGLDEKRWPARQFATLVDGWKNKGQSPNQVPQEDAYMMGYKYQPTVVEEMQPTNRILKWGHKWGYKWFG